MRVSGLVRKEIRISTLAQCRQVGESLGRLLQGGDSVLLYGDLGAGKTTLTGFLALGLGVAPEQPVTSPSFSLVHEYQGRCPLFHIDCYRLAGEEDVEAAGLTEYLDSRSGVCVVEWPERLGRLRPPDSLAITIAPGPGEERCLMFSGSAKPWAERLGYLFADFALP